jgi:hypothetical protein
MKYVILKYHLSVEDDQREETVASRQVQGEKCILF